MTGARRRAEASHRQIMHGTTEVTKRYDPPATANNPMVDVKINVEGVDDDEALALADCLYNAIEDTHSAFKD